MSALDVLYGLVLDTGARWGEAAEPWQRADAAAVLEPGDGDPRLHWLGRAKGGSKSTDAAGMSIAWLLEQARSLGEGYVVASDGDQANRLLNKARGFVDRTEGLRGRVRVEASRIVGPNGAYVEALAADEAGAQDLLTPWVIVDEIANWKATATARGMWTAAFSAVPKWPGCRLAVLTFAGDPGHWSYKIRERARESERWRFVELPGPTPWASADDLDEQRALLLPSQYVRRHENRWIAAEDRLTTIDDVAACMKPGGVIAPIEGLRYMIGVDLGIRSDRTVIAVCHVDRDPDTGASCVVLDRMEAFEPAKGQSVDLDVVEDTILVASRSYNGAAVVCDPWQMLAMAQRLRAARVRVEEFTFSQASVGRLAMTLYRLLRDHQLDLPDDDALRDELANVRLIETSPGVVRLDHDPDKHDDRAIALALAATHLLERAPSSPRRLICR